MRKKERKKENIKKRECESDVSVKGELIVRKKKETQTKGKDCQLIITKKAL